MEPFRRWLKRYGVLIPLLLFIVGGGLLLTYLSGTLGTQVQPISGTVTPFDITLVPPLPGTPVARYGPIDPALIDILEYGQPEYGVASLDVYGPEIAPVGAYLPATGNLRFDLLEPTPLPTPLPYPTSPPLPLPAVPGVPVATVSAFNEDGTPRTLPYAGDNCAPAGNPVDGILTQRYHVYHTGIDIGVPLGTPVIATHSGRVIYADWSEIGYGYLVIVQNGPFITYYAHNMSFNVSVNALVGKGSIIAWSGSTGNSSGPHVHYETRINDVPVNPLGFEDRGYPSC